MFNVSALTLLVPPSAIALVARWYGLVGVPIAWAALYSCEESHWAEAQEQSR